MLLCEPSVLLHLINWTREQEIVLASACPHSGFNNIYPGRKRGISVVSCPQLIWLNTIAYTSCFEIAKAVQKYRLYYWVVLGYCNYLFLNVLVGNRMWPGNPNGVSGHKGENARDCLLNISSIFGPTWIGCQLSRTSRATSGGLSHCQLNKHSTPTKVCTINHSNA